MPKKFIELFKRYTPSNKYAEILDAASEVNVRADREMKLAEIRAFFPYIVAKIDLYEIERGIMEAYVLNHVKILPQYPSELFSESYLPEIFTEAKRVGVVANGFFNDYSVETDDDEKIITVMIPFALGGIGLLDMAETNQVLSNIIRSEFLLDYKVSIIQSENYSDGGKSFLDTENERFSRLISDAQMAQAELDESEENEKEELKFDRVNTLFPDKSAFEIVDENIVRSGQMKFDLSSPAWIHGEEMIINPHDVSPIRELTGVTKNVITLGRVFEILVKESRRGDKMNITLGLTDNDSSIYIKESMSQADAEALLVPLSKQGTHKVDPKADLYKVGAAIAIRGSVRLDSYDNNDPCMRLKDVSIIKEVLREDKAEEKRVELHLHTTMSSMDATIPPEIAVETAFRWGHKAVAITDHGNLQAYPIAMNAAEKLKGAVKVIYGIEAYFADDTARAVYGGGNPSFEDEFVIFDIETTGLSALNNKITEIGAVVYKSGEILDEFNMYVNPHVPIPKEITELTGISDETVKDAPDIAEVIPQFLTFIGDRMLVAHNANFDVSFIRYACERCGAEFTNSYLDTVSLSRYVNPELKRHRLDTLAEYFQLGNFNHHRASDDARMLAEIFRRMTDKLSEEGVLDIAQMNAEMSENSDPLKLNTFHQIILVKNAVGLKNLYKLVSFSYLNYFRRHPRIPKTLLEEYREGLVIGSACEAGELYQAILENKPESDLVEMAKFYDYLEIQPLCNNEFMVADGKVPDHEALRDINRKIVALGKKADRPVVATCDAHFLNDEDEIYRKILLSGMKFKDGDRDIHLYYRTTEEMLEEFEYLGKDVAYEVVVTNTNLISDMIEDIRPIPLGTYAPAIDGADQDLTDMCWAKAREMYSGEDGETLPPEVHDRLKKELDSIIKNGFAVLYMIAQKLVANSMEKGYLVGSRGSVGSSIVATMSGITRVNPLSPHYLCPKCRYSDFTNEEKAGSGFDLPDKKCPKCGEELLHDGHDIPFETFLGFYGDKSPDIDLNFSGDVQSDAHKFTEVLFGEGKAFRAGTIGTLASKTAFGFTAKYLEGKGICVNRAEVSRLISKCIGVRRTTGQHPGGIIVVPNDYDIYDFTPVQHPADDPNSEIITTHFAFTYLHDTILKLDILGHDIPTKYKRLEEYTNVKVLDVPMNDPKVIRLFTSTEPLGVSPGEIFCETGTYGLPEMGTKLVRSVLLETQPKTFADLVQISGLTHGTDVWHGNAQELIKNKTCTISEVIGTRDDIMLNLINKHDIEKSLAFAITEDVRKGKGLTADYEKAMVDHGVPGWYIDSCKKIKYMFPKAHAAAYVTDAIVIGWYKIYYPLEFYAAFFTAAPAGFDSEIVMNGQKNVVSEIKMLEEKGLERTQKESSTLDTLLMVNEFYCRGLSFLPISIEKSSAKAYVPENGKVRLPFASLPGLGDTAADKIIEARETNDIYSVEDLKHMAKLSKTVIDTLEKSGALDGMAKTNQLTMF